MRSLTHFVRQVPLYALLLFSSGRISMELDRGVTVHLGARQEHAVHLRAWPRIGVLVNGLRKIFDQELEGELEEPGFGGAFAGSSVWSLNAARSHSRCDAGPVTPAVNAMLELLSRDGGLR